jgi:hypothetical protein
LTKALFRTKQKQNRCAAEQARVNHLSDPNNGNENEIPPAVGSFAAVLGIDGCDGYYTAYPGSVSVAVYDRPYYRGPGYWSGHTYYVWKPGHWVYRNGQKIWRRGHYVVRGY